MSRPGPRRPSGSSPPTDIDPSAAARHLLAPVQQPMGAVLLGGSSRRMGTDKAALRIDGTSLTVRAVDAVRRALAGPGGPGGPGGQSAPRILLVGRDQAPDTTNGTTNGTTTDPAADTTWWLPDLRPGAGPLAGLETALASARRRGAAAILVVAIDHPWLRPAVLRLLLDRLAAASADRDAVVLGTARGPQPLIGAYRPRAHDAVGALLDAGERRLLQVVEHLDIEVVDPADWRVRDPSGASAVDVDTPEELDAARRWQRRVAATASASLPGSDRDTPRVPVVQIRGGRRRDVHDELIAEEPLQLLAAGPGQQPVPLITTMRTPGHERELAVGWLISEGFAGPQDIVEVAFGDAMTLARPDDTVTVSLRIPVDPTTVARRHAVATASCGVCGRASIAALTDRLEPLIVPAADGSPGTDRSDEVGGGPLPWDVLARLPDELRLAQPRFATTGGVHAAGLFEQTGRVVTVREDVGRHNALDAVVGAQALGGVWPADGLHDLVGVLSGRIGYELVAKAAAARLPILAAVGAASDLAVRTADALGITMVGFLRDGDGTVYTHPERLVLPDG